MISKDRIQKMLEIAVHAPSGDNSQPWRFEVGGNNIDIYNLPEKDNPILNYEQRGSYIAHGGLIENIVIASPKFGCSAEVRAFPDRENQLLTARIVLSPNSKAVDSLADFILERHTNRRPYEDAPLTRQEFAALTASVEHFQTPQGISFVFKGDPRHRRLLAEASSSIEEVILENRELHRLLFKDVVWTEKEERRINSGLFMATMEFAPPQKIVFWLASHWLIMKSLNAVGLARFIAREDAKLYATGAGFGALFLKNSNAEGFLLAGRVMQRLWLTAVSLNLSLQPVTGTVFAGMRLGSDMKRYFSEEHIGIIQFSHRILLEILGAKRETIAMLFRIGHADPPSAFASRKHPNITFK